VNLYMKLFGRVMAPADDAGADLGGTEVIDRGDSIVSESEAVVEKAEETVEDAAPAPAAKAEEAPRDPDTGKFIPKGVFDSRMGKEREAREAAERRAAELEAQLGKVSRSEDVAKLEESIEALEKQHAKLILDGDHERASQVMRDIRMTERRISNQMNAENMAQYVSQTREEMKLDDAISRLESTYAPLNPNDGSFNQELVDDVLGWQQVYITRDRLSPSAALTKAADKVMASVKTDAPTAAPAAGLSAGQTPESSRKAEQVAKNIAAAAAQPASLKLAGKDGDKAGITGSIDMNTISDEDYLALPESMKAQLRGDLG